MATEITSRIEDLTKLATDFVMAQKGLWDHAAWTDFLSRVRKKGFDISGDLPTNLGNLLEAMKGFYAAAASTESVEKAMRSVVNDSVAFVKQHHGVWGHSEWEDFLKTIRQNTSHMSEGMTTYLGGVLESLKVFYALSPVAAVHQRASSTRAIPGSASQTVSSAEKKADVGAAEGRPHTQAKAGEKPKTMPKGVEKKEDLTVPTPPPPEGKPYTQAKAVEKPKTMPKGVEKKDDLTVIDGIGQTLAKRLSEAGISSYAQLAALSEEDMAQLDKSMNLRGRMKREDWIGQAKKLSEGR